MPQRPNQHTVIPAEPGWAIVGFDDATSPAVYVAAIIAWDVVTCFDEEGHFEYSAAKPIVVSGTADWEYRWFRQPDGQWVRPHDSVTFTEASARTFDQEWTEHDKKAAAA